MSKKLVLDACCGSKMMWYDKNNPIAVFGDIRKESHILCDGRKLEINPDVIMDYRDMRFEDDSFYITVFDPSHMHKLGASSWMAKKYGKLPADWQDYLKRGFSECMRVTKPYGTVIVKWNESQITERQFLDAIGHEPLFGHRSGKGNKTIWMTFIKHELGVLKLREVEK